MNSINTFFRQALISLLIMGGFFWGVSRVDWMDLMGLKPTFVADITSRSLWHFMEMQIDQSHDQDAIHRLDSMVTRLCHKNNLPEDEITVVLAKDSEVNAYATVGSHLVVNTGLLDDCRSDAELMGVLAHEVAHLQLGHIQRSVQAEFGTIVFFTLISGGQNSGTMANILKEITTNAFSRHYEQEADDTAVTYLQKAGTDPCALADFLDRMPSYGPLSYAGTHPDSRERANTIRRKAKKLSKNKAPSAQSKLKDKR